MGPLQSRWERRRPIATHWASTNTFDDVWHPQRVRLQQPTAPTATRQAFNKTPALLPGKAWLTEYNACFIKGLQFGPGISAGEGSVMPRVCSG
jgi:hypothetical protein